MKLSSHKAICPYGYKLTLQPFKILIEQGSTTAIQGDNGSGKSTLIKLLLGIHHPNYAFHSFTENDNNGVKVSGFAQPVPFDPQLTLKDNLTTWGAPFNKSLFDHYTDKLELQQHLKTKWEACSSGNRQKFGIAVALAADAEIYILDEPLAHVDQSSVRIIIELINEKIEKGAGFAIASHLHEQWPFTFDHQYLIEDGKIFNKTGNS